MPTRHAALLLLGHGSTLNADSSGPTYQHAEEIRRRGEFAEVHVGFWKEEPNFRQALRQTRQRKVFVVPNFISSGYFTEQIIPRELGLTGPITQIEGQEVYYCEPVGLSPAMTDVLLKRAREVVAMSPEPCDPKKTCLFICGHGTSLNDNSTKIIHEQATLIRAKGIYGDCQAVLMEQRPFVKDWRTLTDCPDVIVVPFFISDGLHSYEDIPVLLSLTHNIHEKGFDNPHKENDRRLWYATAIGTDTSIGDAILEQVKKFERDHVVPPASDLPTSTDSIDDDLKNYFKAPEAIWTVGELLIWRYPRDVFRVTHERNDGWGQDWHAPYWKITSLEELRRVFFADFDGHFRPLRAAPNLRWDWYMEAKNLGELRAIIDYIYPAALANWALWQRDHLSTTPWKETAERQTGRFRVVREIDDAGIRELTAQICDRGCLKRRLWAPAAQPVESRAQKLPLLCPEACNYLVGKAREKLKGPDGE